MGNQRLMTSASVSNADRRCVGDVDAGGAVTWLVDWLTNGPQPQLPQNRRTLVLHSQTKKRTLILAVISTLLMIGLTATITGASWAYGWFVIEALFGATRYVALLSLEKAEAEGREGSIATATLLGLAGRSTSRSAAGFA